MGESVVLKKNHLLAVVGAVFMISVFIMAAQAVVANAGSAQNTNYGIPTVGSTAPVQDKQIVKVTMQGSSYMPNPIRLKKGVPVELDIDTNSVQGCYRGIQIPAFGIRKVVTPTDNKIEFTPDKAGTFAFSCFMGMGKGQIVVEDETGNVPASINTIAQDTTPSGGSCGSGGGGCGCGGAVQ